MRSKIRRLGIGVTLAIIIALTIGAVSYSAVGVTCEVGTGGLPLSVYELSAVPQSVAEDAARLATELFGDCQEKCNDFMSQLLATYSEAKDRDFVVIFNSGGWGWNLLETSLGWQSIFTGIEPELASSGYTSLLLDYQRTEENWRGCLNELVERITGYPSKAKDLAVGWSLSLNISPTLGLS